MDIERLQIIALLTDLAYSPKTLTPEERKIQNFTKHNISLTAGVLGRSNLTPGVEHYLRRRFILAHKSTFESTNEEAELAFSSVLLMACTLHDLRSEFDKARQTDST